MHDAESTIGGMVALNNESRQTHNDQQRRIELRIQVLTAVIAVAALAEPFLYAAVHP